MRRLVLSLVAALTLTLMFPAAQTQAPPPETKPAEKLPAPEKPPAISEVHSLKIQNALLRATAAQATYEKAIKDQRDIILAVIAEFEGTHPTWTIDAQKMTVVKKAVAK